MNKHKTVQQIKEYYSHKLYKSQNWEADDIIESYLTWLEDIGVLPKNNTNLIPLRCKICGRLPTLHESKNLYTYICEDTIKNGIPHYIKIQNSDRKTALMNWNNYNK